MFKKTKIDGVVTLQHPGFQDKRGKIQGIFHARDIHKIYFSFQLLEGTHAFSKPSVLRGLHAQSWDRIVYPISGKIMQVFVDLRRYSKTFKKVHHEVIDDKNRTAYFVPAHVANGYLVLGNTPAHYLYLLASQYYEEYTYAVAWNDPDLKIPWSIKKPILSKKDAHNPTFQELLKGGKLG